MGGRLKTPFMAILIFGAWASARAAEPLGDFSFNPISVKRDPFQPPEVKGNSALSDLNRYDLNEMKLVAIMTGLGQPQAMIVLPNNRTHIVQKGDSIGRQNGRIQRITANEVTVKEFFKDFRGNTKESTTSLVIAE